MSIVIRLPKQKQAQDYSLMFEGSQLEVEQQKWIPVEQRKCGLLSNRAEGVLNAPAYCQKFHTRLDLGIRV